MTRTIAFAATAFLITSAVVQGLTKPAAPLDPITAIVDAFRTHDVVALGEGRHNNEQGYAFRLALIRDPRSGERFA